MAQRKKEETIDGVTIKYHANGQIIWSEGKIVDGVADGYWEWYRIEGTIKRCRIKMHNAVEVPS